MKAYAYTGALQPFSLRELPTPRPSAHQVLVRARPTLGMAHSTHARPSPSPPPPARPTTGHCPRGRHGC